MSRAQPAKGTQPDTGLTPPAAPPLEPASTRFCGHCGGLYTGTHDDGTLTGGETLDGGGMVSDHSPGSGGGPVNNGEAPDGGEAAPSDAHRGCGIQLQLEPPRYCRQCGRRLKVQVTPLGWRANCSRHGTFSS